MLSMAFHFVWCLNNKVDGLQLFEHNLTLDEFRVYRKVKNVIQSDDSNVKNTRKKAEALASEAIHKIFAF
jgi:hypothetical protein